jgi:hypothetical protein
MNTCTMLMCENVKYEYLHYVDEAVNNDGQQFYQYQHSASIHILHSHTST